MKKVIFLSIFLLSSPSLAAPFGSLNNLNLSIQEMQSLPKGKRPEITVAVIDTGIATKHPDLKRHLWINPGESGLDIEGRDKAFNGIDDDKNGYVDDLQGWNFIENNNQVEDRHGHGSHVAGIILGKSEPTFIKEILPIKIMVLRYFDSKMDFTKTIDYTVAAIRYAVDNGADLINYSSSGETYNAKERAAIQYAKDHGVLFVTAAGNAGKNLNKYKFYPAMYHLKNIISVAAYDENKRRLASSNYGQVSTQAYGKAILSSYPGGIRKKMTGTSQATAFVSRELASYLLRKDEGQLLGVTMEGK